MRYLCTYCLMNAELNSYICQVTGAKTARKLETIQSLWSGYGDIRRVILEGAERNTLIVKAISIETKNQHPRGWDGAIGHQRKLNSYEVETYWYKHWNDQCNKQCRTPLFLGYLSTQDYQYILMEDLDKVFPFRKEVLVTAELQACLTWLAEFHATFMLQQPTGLWEQGSYWHLDTRPEEWENIEKPNVKEKASWINEELKNAKYKTIIHGDAKLANFCFGKKAGKVAVLDFQYVGAGCGMKDVAYFLGSCLESDELQQKEPSLLHFYFQALHQSLQSTKSTLNFNSLEEEWRALYPFACADFARFLLGWSPYHKKLNTYLLGKLTEVLSKS